MEDLTCLSRKCNYEEMMIDRTFGGCGHYAFVVRG